VVVVSDFFGFNNNFLIFMRPENRVWGSNPSGGWWWSFFGFVFLLLFVFSFFGFWVVVVIGFNKNLTFSGICERRRSRSEPTCICMSSYSKGRWIHTPL